MRDLTPEELKLAPEWAKHYAIDDDGDVLFFDDGKNKVQLIDGTDEFSASDYRYVKRISLHSKVIEKPFDITKHEFYDCEVKLESVCEHLICFEVSNKYPEFNKKDIIAAAKALGVTGGDIK